MKKSFLKTVGSTITEYVNTETGELLDSETKYHSFLANNKEGFFLGYVSLLFNLREISWTAIQVYAYLLMNYPTTSKIGITSDIKDDIRKFMRSSAKSNEVINRGLRELEITHYLIKCEGTNSTYKINPRYAFKGSSSDRNAALKAVIELECPDC